VDLVVVELALIVGAVVELKDAPTRLEALVEFALVSLSIGPYLHPSAILLVVFPLALIYDPIGVLVLAKPIRLIILPLPLVDIAIRMMQRPFP
jgi:hypothetical protein